MQYELEFSDHGEWVFHATVDFCEAPARLAKARADWPKFQWRVVTREVMPW